MINFILYYLFGYFILNYAHAKLNDELPASLLFINLLGALIWPIALGIVLGFSDKEIIIWKKKK